MLEEHLTGCEEECLLRVQVVRFTKCVTCQLGQEDVRSNQLIPGDTTVYCCGFVHLFLGEVFIVLSLSNSNHQLSPPSTGLS
jgi:hypothetical protein